MNETEEQAVRSKKHKPYISALTEDGGAVAETITPTRLLAPLTNQFTKHITTTL